MKTHLVIPELKFEKNICAAIRSAEAFGCTEIDLIGRIRIDKHKITRGGDKHIKINRFKSNDECINYLIMNGLKVVCMENDVNSVSLLDYKFPADVALVMGHEVYGVPNEFKNGFTAIRIPQYGLMKCLNTSIAASIVLYERFKQRLKI